jgi:hypothetical protein
MALSHILGKYQVHIVSWTLKAVHTFPSMSNHSVINHPLSTWHTPLSAVCHLSLLLLSSTLLGTQVHPEPVTSYQFKYHQLGKFSLS